MVLRAGFHGTVGQPSAQVIDGSLKFDRTLGTYLEKTFSSSGNRTTWTWSGWVKKLENNTSQDQTLFGGYGASNNTDWLEFGFGGSSDHSPADKLYWTTNGTTNGSSALLRDNSGWMNIVFSYNGSEFNVWKNGELIHTAGTSGNYGINGNWVHRIGKSPNGDQRKGSHNISQVYFIDGLALGPDFFGFTDPLTNTWKPRKFQKGLETVNDGTTWTTDLTTNGGTSWFGGAAANVFDGNIGTFVQGALGEDVTFAPTTPIRVKKKLRIWADSGSGFGVGTGPYQISYNGTQIYNSSMWDSPYEITIAPGTSLSSLVLDTSASGEAMRLFAIEVDGIIMKNATTQNLDFGTNGFYLPMDGNSPIGKDQSGNGNDWTPVNFGSSVALDKATGALPILNTVSGGNYATVGVRTDENASNLVLAMPLVGVATDLSAKIKGSGTAKGITVSGATASTAESNLYGGSFVFDGTDDQIIVGDVATDLDFGTGDYTAEAWFRLTGTGDEYIMNMNTDHGGAAPHWGINIYSTNLIRAGRTDGSGDASHSVSHTFITNKWYHVAVSRSSGTSRLFLDGNLLDEEANTDDIDPTGNLLLGNHSGSDIWYNGYIQDVRIYKGVGKYTKAFNPPSTSPDILPDTPSGVSGSSKLTKITDGAVSFDGSGDYLELADSADFDFGSGEFTVEAFIQGANGGNRIASVVLNQSISGAGSDSAFYFGAGNNGTSLYLSTSGSAWTNYIECAGLVHNSGWHHIAWQRRGDVMEIYVDGIKQTVASGSNSGDAAITGSVYNSSRAVDVGRQSTSGSNFLGHISNLRVIKGTALYTSNFTPPTAPLTNVTNTKLLCCQSNTSAGAAAVSPNLGGVNDGTVWSDGVTLPTSSVTGAATNLFDGSIATFVQTTNSSDWIEVNLGSVSFSTSFELYGSSSYNQNYEFDHAGGTYAFNGNFGGDAWLDFASNLTSPVTAFRYKDSGGTGSASIAAVKVDSVILTDPVSPIGDAAATNFNPFNTDINTVRGQETGYATMNPLDKHPTSATEDGNLVVSNTSNLWCGIRGTFGRTSGKFYYEVKTGGAGSGGESVFIGLGSDNTLLVTTNTPQNDNTTMAAGTVLYCDDGQKILDSSTRSSYGTAISNQDLIGVAYDLDNKTIEFFNDGISQGVIDFSSTVCGGANQIVFPYYISYYNSTKSQFNFGQKPFKFPPPDGFQPLNTANTRPVKVISRPDQYVGITTWKGDGTNNRVIQTTIDADFAWVKFRNQSYSHSLYDTVRGNNNRLVTNSTDTEGTVSFSFLNNKRIQVSGASDTSHNDNNDNLIAWMWKAGGNKNTFNIDDVGYETASAAGLNAGTITPTGASVGTRSGFSIITYTGNGTSGATISHGLQKTPQFFVVKSRNTTATGWLVYHKALTATSFLELQSTAATGTNSTAWNDTEPTSSLITFGNSAYSNGNTQTYVCYAWADIPGLQKFGRYQGNGNADGPFIELGFRPAVIMLKNDTNAGNNWWIIDSERSKYNGQYAALFPNTNGTENNTSAVAVDFLSNGFKCRGTDGGQNPGSGSSFVVYAAWAEAPSIDLYGGGANAR